MASADKELEDSLMEVGRRLFSPPSDTEELLILLDRTENYLLKVDQSASPSIFAALRPVREALVAKDLLGHSNLEVKAAVASCVSEFTRITAPDAPYDDDRMKVIFQMIVESFEKLDDISSRSFPRRVSILENMAKARLCVVMLDLECDALILDMFRFFLKTIRPSHPENVFSFMELIMSLMLEESEDISPELISCLLNCVKKDNKEVLPVAHRLGEKVISNSAAKLKPYLVQAQSLPGSYSKIVASICQENSDALEKNEINSSGENLVDGSKLSERTVSDELSQGQEVPSPEKVAPADISPISVTNNGTILSGVGDITVEPTLSSQNPEVTCCSSESKNTVSLNRADSDDSESMDLKSDSTLDHKTEKAKGRKPNLSIQVTDTEEYSQNDSYKVTPPVPSKIDGHNKETGSSKLDSLCAMETESTESLEPEEETDLQPLHRSDNGSPYRSSPAPSEDVPGTKKSKRGRPLGSEISSSRRVSNTVAVQPASTSEEKGTVLDDEIQDYLLPSEETVKASEPPKISEEKRPGKKMRSETADKIASLTSDLEAKSVVKSGKKGLRKKVTKRGRPLGSKISSSRRVPNTVAVQPASTSEEKGTVLDDEIQDDLLPSEETVKASEPPKISEEKRPGKKMRSETADKIASLTSNLEAKSVVKSGKKGLRKKVTKGSSKKKQKSHGKQPKGDVSLVKDVTRESNLMISGIAEDVDQQLKLDESIVGFKIKVWWPDDERFYYGRVDSFDPSNEKHKIVYADDEVEVLILKEERFDLLEDVVEIEDQPEDVPSAFDSFDSPEVVPSNKKAKANPGGLSRKGKKKVPLKSDEHASGAASKPKVRPLKKSKDTPASQAIPEITAPDSADEHGSGAVKSLAGKPKGCPPKKSKETPVSTSLRTTGLDSSDEHDSRVLKSSMGKPKGRHSKILKETPLSKSEYETPKTVSNKGKGSGRKSNEDTPELATKDGAEMEYTAAATPTTGARKSKDVPPKAARKSNDDTPRTDSKVKRDTPKMSSKSMDVDTPLSSVKYKDVSVKSSSKSTDVDPPKSFGKFKGASVKSCSKSVDVDLPRSSGKYKDGLVKSSSNSIGVDALKTIVDAPKSSSKYKDGSVKSSSKSTVETSKAIVDHRKPSSGKYKDVSVKSSSKFIGETQKSIGDAAKSSGKYKESSMKSHSKSMDLDSPKSFGKHKDASGKASIKPMDVDIPKSSGKSRDGSMKTSESTAKGGPKMKPKGDVTLQTVGDESTFDGSSEKGKGKVRAGESSETKLYKMQTLAKVQASLGSADNSRKRKACK